MKCYAIVPDLPEHMYMHSNFNGLSMFFKKRYLQKAIRVQALFDGYIYLTEAMKMAISPEKPYVVVEGIADSSSINDNSPSEKQTPRGIMYAGGLQKKYGIINLLDAFECASIDNAELWLFGDGDAVEEIVSRAQNNPTIRFFGRVSRNEVLLYERKATLLINVRNGNEEFTKYSFPSKTIEYMLSGTPLLSTRLEGIPLEYFDYMYSISDNSTLLLSEKLKEIMNESQTILAEKGLEAHRYIAKEKNSLAQAKKIIDALLLANSNGKSG